MIYNPDPMGEALEAYQNGETSASLIVHSSIAEDDVIPVAYLFREFSDMPELEKLALDFCKGKVLDIGAGAGSHALWLEENGFKVKAIDISEKAVAVMKKRGILKAEAMDFWNLEPTEKFDTLLLLMNGIGLAGGLEKVPEFLAKLKTLINPGGQVLLESSDILYMFEEEDGSVTLDLNGAYYGEIEYQMAFNNQTGKPFPWLFIDYQLLEENALEAGFTMECLYEGENAEYLARLSN